MSNGTHDHLANVIPPTAVEEAQAISRIPQGMLSDQRAADETTADDEPAVTVERVRALIANSQRKRAELENLLEQFDNDPKVRRRWTKRYLRSKRDAARGQIQAYVVILRDLGVDPHDA